MSKEIIFETEHLLVRRLVLSDLTPFHVMESNPKVLQYATGEVKSLEAHEKELEELIVKYSIPRNDFWIYAIERKSDLNFIGTIAFVKDNNGHNEIGYRFLEKYWKNGYGTEIVRGMVLYCKEMGLRSLMAYVAYENIASDKIIKKAGFTYLEDSFCEEAKVKERKYTLEL
ncbi:MAG: GNAT family N-acetyltransferase [Flavobacteriaceae bacterium]|nr:GNAT family N-acetyltransferase [Flavobacteriaceae bacterium]